MAGSVVRPDQIPTLPSRCVAIGCSILEFYSGSSLTFLSLAIHVLVGDQRAI